jgi:Protein of unknown function (DUF4232)
MSSPALPSARRASAAAAVVLVGLAPLAAGHVLRPSRAAAAGGSRCRTPGLVVWLDTNGNSAAGSTYYKLKLTNLSGHACTLFGYPGVSAVNLRGAQLGSAASRDTARTPHTVRLGIGATAVATLRIVSTGNFPSSSCHPTRAAGLRVYPPNATASKIVPFPFRACARSGPSYLSVRAVRKQT